MVCLNRQCFLRSISYPVCGFLYLVYSFREIYVFGIQGEKHMSRFSLYWGDNREDHVFAWVLFDFRIDNSSVLCVYCMITVSRKGSIPAPHTFRSSFGRTAKSRVSPIRHRGGEAHSNPQYHITATTSIVYQVLVAISDHKQKPSSAVSSTVQCLQQEHHHPACARAVTYCCWDTIS